MGNIYYIRKYPDFQKINKGVSRNVYIPQTDIYVESESEREREKLGNKLGFTDRCPEQVDEPRIARLSFYNQLPLNSHRLSPFFRKSDLLQSMEETTLWL